MSYQDETPPSQLLPGNGSLGGGSVLLGLLHFYGIPVLFPGTFRIGAFYCPLFGPLVHFLTPHPRGCSHQLGDYTAPSWVVTFFIPLAGFTKPSPPPKVFPEGTDRQFSSFFFFCAGGGFCTKLKLSAVKYRPHLRTIDPG